MKIVAGLSKEASEETLQLEVKLLFSAYSHLEPHLYRMFTIGIGLLLIIISNPKPTIFHLFAGWLILIFVILYSMLNRYYQRKYVFYILPLLFILTRRYKVASDLILLSLLTNLGTGSSKHLEEISRRYLIDLSAITNKFADLLDASRKIRLISSLIIGLILMSFLAILFSWTLSFLPSIKKLGVLSIPTIVALIALIVSFGYISYYHVKNILVDLAIKIAVYEVGVPPNYPILRSITDKRKLKAGVLAIIALEILKWGHFRLKKDMKTILYLSLFEFLYFMSLLSIKLNFEMILLFFVLLAFAIFVLTNQGEFSLLAFYRQAIPARQLIRDISNYDTMLIRYYEYYNNSPPSKALKLFLMLAVFLGYIIISALIALFIIKIGINFSFRGILMVISILNGSLIPILALYSNRLIRNEMYFWRQLLLQN